MRTIRQAWKDSGRVLKIRETASRPPLEATKAITGSSSGALAGGECVLMGPKLRKGYPCLQSPDHQGSILGEPQRREWGGTPSNSGATCHDFAGDQQTRHGAATARP